MLIRDILLALEVARMQKAFIGMAVFGMTIMVTDYAPRLGSMSLLLGVIGYLGSHYFVLGRLQRSLDMQLCRMLDSQQEGQVSVFDDGIQDEVAEFQRVTAGMLAGGMRMFHQVGNTFSRVAGQPQLAAAGVRLAEPHVEEVEKAEKDKKAATLRKR